VTNTGDADGHHVIQVYGHRTDGQRPGESTLVGFTTVAVAAGATVEATVPVTLETLGIWNPDTKRLDPPTPTTVAFKVGAHAQDPDAHLVAVTV
jgi:beta-glucosidase